LVGLVVFGGCKKRRETQAILTEEEVVARPFETLSTVCLPRGANDDIVLVDSLVSVFVADPDAKTRSVDETNKDDRIYYRLVTHDAATGARRSRVVLGEMLLRRINKTKVTCLGWIGTKLWLTGRDGLHARDATGGVVVREAKLIAMHPKLANGITGATYLEEQRQLVVSTPSGHELLIHGDPELVVEEPRGNVSARPAPPGPVQMITSRGFRTAKTRTGTLESELRGGRAFVTHGGIPVGDFKHVVELLFHAPTRTYEWDGPSMVLLEPGLEPKAPRTLRRVAFDGSVRWSITEPEPCAGRPCNDQTWQATNDAKRLYYFGARKLYAYDADRGTPLWSAAY
jgi:hypothetical protein